MRESLWDVKHAVVIEVAIDSERDAAVLRLVRFGRVVWRGQRGHLMCDRNEAAEALLNVADHLDGPHAPRQHLRPQPLRKTRARRQRPSTFCAQSSRRLAKTLLLQRASLHERLLQLVRAGVEGHRSRREQVNCQLGQRHVHRFGRRVLYRVLQIRLVHQRQLHC